MNSFEKNYRDKSATAAKASRNECLKNQPRQPRLPNTTSFSILFIRSSDLNGTAPPTGGLMTAGVAINDWAGIGRLGSI